MILRQTFFADVIFYLIICEEIIQKLIVKCTNYVCECLFGTFYLLFI